MCLDKINEMQSTSSYFENLDERFDFNVSECSSLTSVKHDVLDQPLNSDKIETYNNNDMHLGLWIAALMLVFLIGLCI